MAACGKCGSNLNTGDQCYTCLNEWGKTIKYNRYAPPDRDHRYTPEELDAITDRMAQAIDRQRKMEEAAQRRYYQWPTQPIKGSCGIRGIENLVDDGIIQPSDRENRERRERARNAVQSSMTISGITGKPEKKEDIFAMLDKLKNFDRDRVNMEEMLVLRAFGEMLERQYIETEQELPEWLKETLGTINNEIDAKRRDSLEKQLKEADLELEKLKTKEERKEELAAKRERLQRALGRAPKTPEPVGVSSGNQSGASGQ